MENIDILFFVEHRDREMPGTLAVKRFLESRAPLKIKVFSTEFGLLEAWRKYNPKLICMPYCDCKRDMMVRSFHTRNPATLFVNMNYEQIITSAGWEEKRPCNHFTRQELYHLTWGEHYRDMLLSAGTDPSHIFVTGKAEIYFLKKLWEERAELKAKLAAEFGLDPAKRWCFFPMSEGTAFYSRKALELDVATGRRPDIVLPMQEHFYKQSETLVDMIDRLSREAESKNLEIILRPHPGVPVEEYQRLMERQNITPPAFLHINREYTVKEWLCCADVCASNASTVLVDASLVGVPAYVYRPFPLPEVLQVEWLETFEKLETYEAFRDALLYAQIGTVPNDYIRRYINPDLQPIEEMGRAMEALLSRYQDSGKRRWFAAFVAEGPRLIRSGVRNVSVHIPPLRRLINQRLLYDYFQSI